MYITIPFSLLLDIIKIYLEKSISATIFFFTPIHTFTFTVSELDANVYSAACFTKAKLLNMFFFNTVNQALQTLFKYFMFLFCDQILEMPNVLSLWGMCFFFRCVQEGFHRPRDHQESPKYHIKTTRWRNNVEVHIPQELAETSWFQNGSHRSV